MFRHASVGPGVGFAVAVGDGDGSGFSSAADTSVGAKMQQRARVIERRAVVMRYNAAPGAQNHVVGGRAANGRMVSLPIVAYTHWSPPEGPALLAGLADVRTWDRAASPTRAELIAHARDAVVLCFFVPDSIDAALLAALPALRLLAGFGKGFDNVDLAAATARGILVTNVPTALTDATADLAWALLLGLARGIAAGDRAVRANPAIGWQSHVPLGRPITGTTLGLYGFGRVGQAIAARALGFSMSVIYHDPRSLAKDAPQARPVDEATLFAEADHLVLAVPLDATSYHLIDAAALARMKPGALLVNPARGSVVDEAAVAVALANGSLGGYAADVFEHEDRQIATRPGRVNEALVENRDRTLFTPHLGTAVAADRVRLAIAQAQSVCEFLAGKTPRAIVSPLPSRVPRLHDPPQ